MKTMSVGEFKTRFSDVIEWVKAGEKVAVTYGKKKEVIGYFVPEAQESVRRKLGLLEGKRKLSFIRILKSRKKNFWGHELPVGYPYAYLVDDRTEEIIPKSDTNPGKYP
jgi:antitoxin (DNA-binding transcriptional repressor) of toxin-antitoxin stability system